MKNDDILEAEGMTNYSFLAFIFILSVSDTFPQIFSGKIINEQNGKPVPYANIGIIGKNVGTTSDECQK